MRINDAKFRPFNVNMCVYIYIHHHLRSNEVAIICPGFLHQETWSYFGALPCAGRSDTTAIMSCFWELYRGWGGPPEIKGS